MKNYKKFLHENYSKNKQKDFVDKFGFDYHELLNSCENSFGYDDADFELNWYLNELIRLYNDGGSVYRIVKLPYIDALNKDELGNHWITDKGIITRIIGNLEYIWDNEEEYDEFLPYLITGYVQPKSINVKNSLAAFKQLPEEGEIFIGVGLVKFEKIEKHKE